MSTIECDAKASSSIVVRNREGDRVAGGAKCQHCASRRTAAEQICPRPFRECPLTNRFQEAFVSRNVTVRVLSRPLHVLGSPVPTCQRTCTAAFSILELHRRHWTPAQCTTLCILENLSSFRDKDVSGGSFRACYISVSRKRY